MGRAPVSCNTIRPITWPSHGPFVDGHFSPLYGLPFSPGPAKPRVYFQPLTLALGVLWKLTGGDPGILYMIADLVLPLCCARVMIALYSEVASGPRWAVALGLVCFFWGGRCLTLAGSGSALVNGEPPLPHLLDFDPFEGFWFRNLGRNMIYATEAFYHPVFLGAVLLVLRRRFGAVLLCTAALSASHVFSGLQLIAVLGTWSVFDRLIARDKSAPLFFQPGSSLSPRFTSAITWCFWTMPPPSTGRCTNSGLFPGCCLVRPARLALLPRMRPPNSASKAPASPRFSPIALFRCWRAMAAERHRNIVNLSERLLWFAGAAPTEQASGNLLSADIDTTKPAVIGGPVVSAGAVAPSPWLVRLNAALVADRSAPSAAVAAFGVFALPFAAFTSLMLYHFYVKGGFLWDSGLLAFLASQSDPALPTPHILGGGSFYATHASPIFALLGHIRQLLPVTDIQFFAGFSGFCHALPGLAVFWLLSAEYRLRTPLGTVVAALLGLAFSFNGLALAIARYPHFEMLIVGAALLFFVALLRSRFGLAALLFAVCLATREDAGFHLFAVLFLLIALDRWRGLSWRAQRAEIAFAAVAIGYGLVVLAAQHAVFTGQSSFARIYLGKPAFGHISTAVLIERLTGYVRFRTYLVLPALIALVWAVRTRNPYILLGYVAFLPWGALHLFAESDIAGTLSAYYAYPFMIASFWPLIAVRLDDRVRGAHAPAAVAALAFAGMVAGSFTALGSQANPGDIDLPAGFLSAPSPARQDAAERAVAELVRAKGGLGRVFVDGSILALAPDGFLYDETVWGGKGNPDTVIYFAGGYESAAARAIAASAGLDKHYQAPGTAVRVATKRPIPPAPPLAVLLAPAAGSD